MKTLLNWIRNLLRNWLLAEPKSAAAEPAALSLEAAASRIVAAIETDPRYRAVVEREGNIQFCPRCGQKPWRDYRCEEAFAQLTLAFPDEKRSDIYYAIELAVKNGARAQ